MRRHTGSVIHDAESSDSDDEILVVSPGKSRVLHGQEPSHKFKQQEEEKKRIQSQLKFRDSQYKSLKQEYASLLSDFEQRVSKDEAEISRLRKEAEAQHLDSLEETKTKELTMIKDCRRIMNTSDLKSYQDCMAIFEKAMKARTSLEHEIESTKKELVSSESKVTSLEHELNLALENNKKNDVNNKELYSRNRVLVESEEGLRNEIEEVKIALHNVTNQNAKLSEELKQLLDSSTTTANDLNTLLEQKKQENSDLSVQLEGLLIKEKEWIQTQVVQKENQIIIKHTKNKLETEINNLRDREEQLEKEVRLSREENKELKSHVKKLECELNNKHVQKELNGISSDNEDTMMLRKKLKKSSMQLTVLNKQFDELKQENKYITSKMEELDEIQSNLETELKTKEETIVGLTAIVNAIKVNEDKSSLNSRTDASLLKMKELRDENSRLVSSLSKIEEENNKAKESLRKEKQELRSTLEYVVEENEKLKIEINEMKVAYEEQIKEQNETNILVMEKLYDAMNAEQNL